MGNTFSTLQIKNNTSAKPNELLLKYMEKKGYIQTAEDSAALSYRLIHSDKSDWVTLLLPEYEDGACIQEDAEGIAKTLKTYCIAIGVWDSDMMTLDLYGPTSKEKDKVFAGIPFDEESPVGQANRKLWEKLLAAGKTFEQLSDILKGDYTFIEDSLMDIAPILGMDPDVTVKYQRYDDAEKNNINDLTLYFKKKDVKKKNVSLNAAFKKIFGEALEPLGFKLIKSKCPYFVRVVEGGEIIHVITYMNSSPIYRDWKGFNIYGGVATVYRQKIDLTWSQHDNGNWLNSICGYYNELNPQKRHPEYMKSLNHYNYVSNFNNETNISKSLYESNFAYKVENDEAMLHEVECSLEATKQSILPVLDNVTNLEKCVEYFDKFAPCFPLNFLETADFNNEYFYPFYNEGLLFTKTNNYHTFWGKKLEDYLSIIAHGIKTGKAGCTQEHYENECRRAEEAKPSNTAFYKKTLGNQEWCSKALTELERRKIANTETLRNYGLEI